jgi:hypothetical protein
MGFSSVPLLVACQGFQTPLEPQPSPSAIVSAPPSVQPSMLSTPSPVSPTPVPSASASGDYFGALQVKKTEPLFPDGIEGVVPGLLRQTLQLAVAEDSPPTIYFWETTYNLVGLKNIAPPITGNILGLSYSDANQNMSYYGSEIYAHNNKCIVKGSTDPQKYPKILFLVAGDCPSSDKLRVTPESLIAAEFTQITSLTVAPNGDIYLIDNKKFKRIRNKRVESLFESGPLGGIEIANTLEGIDSDGLPIGCAMGIGVCQPGTFKESGTSGFRRYRWASYSATGQPISHSIDVYGDDITPQSIPILKDGKTGEGVVWEPQKLQVDNKGNVYFSEEFISETYLRRISPEGQLTTLISHYKDNLLVDPKNRQRNKEGLLPAAHILAQLPGLLPPSPNCPPNQVCFPTEPYFKVFAIDQRRGILYLLGNYLFALDLKSQQLKIVQYMGKSLYQENAFFPLVDMDIDAEGNIYATLKQDDYSPSTAKPLSSPIFQIRLH